MTTPRAQAPRYEGVVDLRRYPIHGPSGQDYLALVRDCRDQLRDRGVAQLAVFRGQHALHRVTPVSGPRPRVNSVLTYGEHPGMKLNRLTRELFYGRTA